MNIKDVVFFYVLNLKSFHVVESNMQRNKKSSIQQWWCIDEEQEKNVAMFFFSCYDNDNDSIIGPTNNEQKTKTKQTKYE